MRIKCLHGYFIFEEQEAGQLSRFMSLTGFSLVPLHKYYTFETLSTAKNYSIAENNYLGALATKTFAGNPWEVMRENGLIYNFNTDEVVAIETITQSVTIQTGANYKLANGLILPGSITADGSRVKEYSAWYLFDSSKFRYTEVSFE